MTKARTNATPVKITRPHLEEVYSRTRLFRRLDTARQRPNIWISAPPGAGKTTLAASYLAENNLQSLWYQLDEGDTDIASFFYYMSLAAKKAAPRKKKSLPLFTPEYALGIPTFTRRYFEQLYGWMPAPFVIVLDNYQTLPANSAVHEVIRDGLELMPEDGNAIIISRKDPPPAYARLRANQNIKLIDWDTLKLDDTEFAEIIRLKEMSPDEKELAYLQSRAGGWVTGLLLLLETVANEKLPDSSVTQLLSKHSPQVVFDYFSTEILQRQDKDTQTFLLQVALLPRMTPEMANELSGVKQSDKILDQLQQNNYFIEHHKFNVSLYQLHPLYREFLNTRARQIYSDVEYSDLQYRSAQVLEKSGQFEAAVQLYITAANWSDSARLICENAREFITQGRGETVMLWINQIPQTILEQTPWLQFWLGASCMVIAPLEGRQHLEQAYWRFKKLNDLPGMCMSLSSIVDTFSFGWHDFFPLDGWIRELETLMAAHPDLPSAEIQAKMTVAMFVALLHRYPNHPDMGLWIQRSCEVLRSTPVANDRVMIGMNLATYYVWWGKHHDMKLLLEELRQPLEADDISPMGFIVFRAIEAMYYTRSLEGDGVQAVLEALARAEQSGVYVINPLLLGLAAIASIHNNNLDAAAAYLTQSAMLFHPARLMDQGLYHWNRGYLAWMQGDIQAALEHARQTVALATQFGSVFHDYMMPVSLAKILVEVDEYKEAREVIANILPGIQEIDNQTLLYECMLVEARSQFAQHDDSAGIEALQQALTLMRKTGAASTIWWNPKWIIPLLARALEKGIEVEYVQLLIRKHNIVPDEQYIALEQWSWPVKINTFGGFSLLINNEPAQPGVRGQNKPLQLLKALIAVGGKDIAATQLIDNLWQDADGDNASHSLKTTVHRLRKLLKNEQAVLLTGGKLSLNPHYCWVDAWAFEQLLEANNTGQPDDAEEIVHYDCLQQAINLYKGSFLHGEADISWLLVPAEKMRNRYLQAIEELAMYREKSNQWDLAIECYESGINTDELAEPLYQRLMICYAQTGRHGEALVTYERYRKLLDACFGVEPSKKIQSLAHKLKS